ncbi:hypothetical protein AB1L88_10020 [Tautonia sp. JC769]|uniref:hypothetical protein n=1 Tax=Tautonia sp. JC769 TaxID=3232135 RepID=UPI00345AA1B9
MVRHVVRITGLALGSLLIACGSGDDTPLMQEEPQALPRLVHLEPGAEVGQGAPEGWTSRVVRSVPRLVSGDLASLPDSAGATATRFRTVITAEVAPPEPRRRPARLVRVGVGNAVPVGNRELVVTRHGPPEAFDSLGVVDRVVLIAAEAKLHRGRLIARSPTFALFQTPTVLVVEGKHREVNLHYALIVEPTTGALTTFCWPDPASDSGPIDAVLRLAPELSFDAGLDARVTRRIGPAPVSWSFAMTSPPPGDRIPLGFGDATALTSHTDVDRLERMLRSLAEQPVNTRRPPRRAKR